METVRPQSKQITVILESHNAEQFNTRKSFSFNLECKVDQNMESIINFDKIHSKEAPST